MPPQRKKPIKVPQSKVRIIGGNWRGRKIPVLETEGLRPSGDRLRETLFNWLQPQIHDARCLDAFAGTGSLGLEALSRGASMCQFIESHTAAARQLTENCEILNANAEVFAGDCLTWRPPLEAEPFDLVFIDPPFQKNLWQQVIDHIDHNIPLSSDALVYVEQPLETIFRAPEHWSLTKDKRIGQVRMALYETSRPVTR